MKEVIVSSGLFLRAFSSLWDTSTIVLKEYYLKNSYARLIYVRRREGSNKANHHWAALLRNRGNNMIICVSSNLWPHNSTVQLQVNTRAPDPCVSLNVQLVELNRQSCNRQVIIPIPTHGSIVDIQWPHPLLNPLNVGLSIICNLCRGNNKMWQSLILTM